MLFTRCPECQTTFRITTDALHKADGRVRCGRCSSVFNAFVELHERSEVSAHALRDVTATEGTGSGIETGQPADAGFDTATEFTGAPTAADDPNAESETAILEAADGQAMTGGSAVDTAPQDEPDTTVVGEPADDGRAADAVSEEGPDPGTEPATVSAHAVDTRTEHETDAEVAAELDAMAAWDSDATVEDEPNAVAQHAAAGAADVDPRSDSEAETGVDGDGDASAARATDTAVDSEPDPVAEHAPAVEAEVEAEVDAGRASDADAAGASDADAAGAGWTGVLADGFGAAVVDSASDAPADDIADTGLAAADATDDGSRAVPAASEADAPTETAKGADETSGAYSVDAVPAIDTASELATLSAEPRMRLGAPLATWLSEDDAPPPRPSAWWRVAAALGAVALLLQAAHHYRAELVRSASIGPTVAALYARLGMPVAPAWNVAQYEIVDSYASAEPNARGLERLVISARIRNKGPDAQPYPELELKLLDRWNAALAQRVFAPDEYLATPSDTLMVPGGMADARLVVVDPGPNAFGFEIDICLTAGARMRCAADDLFR